MSDERVVRALKRGKIIDAVGGLYGAVNVNTLLDKLIASNLLLAPAEHDAQQKRIAELEAEAARLKEENERLRDLLGMISSSNWTELIRLAESLGISHKPREDYEWNGDYETDARRTYPNRLNLICKLTGQALNAGGDDG